MRPDGAIALQALVLAGAVAVAALDAALGLDAGGLVTGLSAALLLQFAWSIGSWRRLAGTVLDPYGLFLVSATLFHSAQPFLVLLGLDSVVLDGRFTDRTLADALFLVTLGLAALHLGALASLRAPRAPAPDAPTPRSLRTVGLALVLVAAAPELLVAARSLRVVLTQGYLALYRPENLVPGVLDILSGFLVPGALLLVAAGGSRARATGVLAVVLPTALSFSLGKRGAATMPLLALGLAWERLVRPIPRALIVAGAGAAAVAFPIIAALRNDAGQSRFSLDEVAYRLATSDQLAVAALAEMGGSLITVTYGVELIPEERPFDGGAGYLYALLTVVPNFFWAVHPTFERGTLTAWLVATVDPAAARDGASFGFSFIAEAYAAFGWPGPAVVLLPVGAAIGAFSRWSREGAARVVAAACFVALALQFPRGESADVVRSLAYYVVLPYVAVKLAARESPPCPA